METPQVGLTLKDTPTFALRRLHTLSNRFIVKHFLMETPQVGLTLKDTPTYALTFIKEIFSVYFFSILRQFLAPWVKLC